MQKGQESHPYGKVILIERSFHQIFNILFFSMLFCMFSFQSFASMGSSSSFRFKIMSKFPVTGIQEVQVTIIGGLEQFKTVTFLNTSATTTSQGNVEFGYSAQSTSTESHILRVSLKLPNGSEDIIEMPFNISNGKTTEINISTDKLDDDKYLQPCLEQP